MKEKYTGLATDMKNSTRHDVIIDVINVGCLGSWDPKNEIALKRVGLTPQQIKYIVLTRTMEAAKESYGIYRTHVADNSSDLLHSPPAIQQG